MASPGMHVSISWNETEIARMLSEGGDIGRAVTRAARKTRDRAKMNLTAAGNVDTGALRNSITTRRTSANTQGITTQVGSPLPYAIIVHEGRGPVVPRRAKVLRFKPKGSGAYVFAPSVGPAEGSKYLTRALEQLSAADFA